MELNSNSKFIGIVLVFFIAFSLSAINVNALETLCDGLDDDGDLAVDEDFSYSDPLWGTRYVGQSCNGIGECGSGIVECIDLSTASCSTNPSGSNDQSSAESCDTLDNDCDGAVDEIFGYNDPTYGTRYVGQSCDGIGECGSGIVECIDLSTASCDTNPDGSDDESITETCDYSDNDCDGSYDEDFTYLGASVGASCDGVGECGAGTVECASSSSADCSTNPGASQDQSSPETCNGDDDDCDGTSDDGGNALCDNGLYCDGEETCEGPDGCFDGEVIDCDDGIDCSSDSCNEASDSCSNVADDNYCDNGLYCDGDEYCSLMDDCQNGASVDCSGNDINPVATCTYTPDGIDWTWDVFTGFVSACIEASDSCSTGTLDVTSTCDTTRCGAECEIASDCPNTCVGEVYNYGGNCGSDCGCFYLTEDCNGNDGWVDTGVTRWVSTGECTEEQQEEQDYNDYSCGAGGCSSSVTNTRWVDTGSTRNVADGTSCSDGLYCTVSDECSSGVCDGSARSCSGNNLPQIATCTNNPDNIAFTWDYFPGFTSTCNEGSDSCSTGTVSVTSTCDISQCGAECEIGTDCASGTCNSDCTCETVENIPGDVNGDCVVDIQDLSLVARAYWTTPGDSRWNPDADLNGDGRINFRDLILVARNYRDTC